MTRGSWDTVTTESTLKDTHAWMHAHTPGCTLTSLQAQLDITAYGVPHRKVKLKFSSQSCRGAKLRCYWTASMGTLGHCLDFTTPAIFTHGQLIHLSNNKMVNAGHCGIFLSLRCQAGSRSSEVRRKGGQVSKPHWPDSLGIVLIEALWAFYYPNQKRKL